MTNKCEVEVNATRVKLYEETKHLTSDERVKRVNTKALKLAEEFGFTVVPSTSENKIIQNVG